MVATCNTPEEMIAFYQIMTEFVNIPAGSPRWLILDGNGITNVDEFTQVSDQFFMDMCHDVVVMDNAGVETTQNQLLQYVKCISLTWLKCYLIYLENEGRSDLNPDELNGLDRADFNSFRHSYSEMPKLKRSTNPNPNYPILAASIPAARFRKSIKHETTQYPILKDVHYFDKFEMEFMTLARTHDIHQVFDPGYTPLTQDEINLFAEKEKFAMSVLVHSIKQMLALQLFASITRTARLKNAGRRSRMRLLNQLELILSSCPCRTSCFPLGLILTGMVMWKVFFSIGMV